MSKVALVGYPKEACRYLTTSFVLGNSYTPMAASVMFGSDMNCILSVIGTIYKLLLSHHPWRAGSAVEDMATSLAWKTFMPSCPGKKTVMYPLFANVDMLISAG